MQQMRRAELLHGLRERDCLRGVVRRGACHDRNTTFRLLDGDLDDAFMLVDGHRRGLAGAATWHQEVDALLDLPVDERTERAFVDGAVVIKRRDEGGAAT